MFQANLQILLDILINSKQFCLQPSQKGYFVSNTGGGRVEPIYSNDKYFVIEFSELNENI